MSPTDTIRYFVFAAILYSLSNFHTWYVEDDIKFGGLTKYLVKPIQPFLYYFSHETATAVLETALKAIVMIPVLIWLRFLPSLTIPQLGLFLLFLPLIFLYSFYQFFIISSLAFWVKEIYAVRWAVMICFRFMAGILVPLSFFPSVFQNILYWTPYPHLAYTPIQVVQGNLTVDEGIVRLSILVSWIATLAVVSHLIWHRGAHSYESTGL